mmetsp:Transcript_29239/g.66242  ORF Transcript_29239/g.66242 Transcript_29239/m.66242 type:complete len:281 (-) Transcript_29239:2097-2939(-)
MPCENVGSSFCKPKAFMFKPCISVPGMNSPPGWDHLAELAPTPSLRWPPTPWPFLKIRPSRPQTAALDGTKAASSSADDVLSPSAPVVSLESVPLSAVGGTRPGWLRPKSTLKPLPGTKHCEPTFISGSNAQRPVACFTRTLNSVSRTHIVRKPARWAGRGGPSFMRWLQCPVSEAVSLAKLPRRLPLRWMDFLFWPASCARMMRCAIPSNEDWPSRRWTCVNSAPSMTPFPFPSASTRFMRICTWSLSNNSRFSPLGSRITDTGSSPPSQSGSHMPQSQ